MSKAEKFNLYLYKTSLGKKHTGIEKVDTNTELMLVAMKAIQEDNDICEIRITDMGDSMMFHWKEEEGTLFPGELSKSKFAAFGPRKS